MLNQNKNDKLQQENIEKHISQLDDDYSEKKSKVNSIQNVIREPPTRRKNDVAKAHEEE